MKWAKSLSGWNAGRQNSRLKSPGKMRAFRRSNADKCLCLGFLLGTLLLSVNPLQRLEQSRGIGVPDRLVPEQEPGRAASPAAELSADEIVARLVEANARRAEQLASYTASRTYQAENRRWRKSAEMEVTVKFTSPDSKVFTVVKESGSSTIRGRVFRGMMKAEKDALSREMKRRTEINASNYRFRLTGGESLEGRPAFVLEVEPLRADKYLFCGRIWVDGIDFAVAKIQGSPAKSPSFWTRKVAYERVYQKVEEFWLPEREEATSEIFIFGKSTAHVRHSNYQIERATP